jgi:hypothetical protein
MFNKGWSWRGVKGYKFESKGGGRGIGLVTGGSVIRLIE